MPAPRLLPAWSRLDSLPSPAPPLRLRRACFPLPPGRCAVTRDSDQEATDVSPHLSLAGLFLGVFPRRGLPPSTVVTLGGFEPGSVLGASQAFGLEVGSIQPSWHWGHS